MTNYNITLYITLPSGAVKSYFMGTMTSTETTDYMQKVHNMIRDADGKNGAAYFSFPSSDTAGGLVSIPYSLLSQCFFYFDYHEVA